MQLTPTYKEVIDVIPAILLTALSAAAETLAQILINKK
jgi:hypothetical protein